MTITLPLQPRDEAKLIAIAQAKGVSTDALVREALDKILADAPDQPAPELDPRRRKTLLSSPQTARARLIITFTAIRREIGDGCFRRHFLLGRADQHRG